jgi:hypothetical protein
VDARASPPNQCGNRCCAKSNDWPATLSNLSGSPRGKTKSTNPDSGEFTRRRDLQGMRPFLPAPLRYCWRCTHVHKNSERWYEKKVFNIVNIAANKSFEKQVHILSAFPPSCSPASTISIKNHLLPLIETDPLSDFARQTTDEFRLAIKLTRSTRFASPLRLISDNQWGNCLRRGSRRMTEQFTPWFSGRNLMSRNARLQIKGAYVPLKYWSEVYAMKSTRRTEGKLGGVLGPVWARER